jgi:hypothetical protein
MELRELGELHWNFAHYKSLAVFMPEVSGLPEANTMLCEMHRELWRTLAKFCIFRV